MGSEQQPASNIRSLPPTESSVLHEPCSVRTLPPLVRLWSCVDLLSGASATKLLLFFCASLMELSVLHRVTNLSSSLEIDSPALGICVSGHCSRPFLGCPQWEMLHLPGGPLLVDTGEPSPPKTLALA